jgi:hypothetical protein
MSCNQPSEYFPCDFTPAVIVAPTYEKEKQDLATAIRRAIIERRDTFIPVTFPEQHVMEVINQLYQRSAEWKKYVSYVNRRQYQRSDEWKKYVSHVNQQETQHYAAKRGINITFTSL